MTYFSDFCIFSQLTRKLDAMNVTIKTLSKTVESQDENIWKKFKLANKSNAALFVQFTKSFKQRNLS